MKKFRPSPLPVDREVAQARFARLVVARLNEDTDRLGPDIAERLRFARERAVESARLARAPAAAGGRTGVTAAGAAILGSGSGSGWWFKLASALPLVALVCGLVLIQQWQTRIQIAVAAEVDAALLSDDIPPTAYSDAGFVEFLKTPPRE
jgi:hypothetical protein